MYCLTLLQIWRRISSGISYGRLWYYSIVVVKQHAIWSAVVVGIEKRCHYNMRVAMKWAALEDPFGVEGK